MQKVILSESPQMPAREIGIVTAEINELRRQANKMATMYAIEIGRRLVEAKSVLPHGEWGRWLKEEVEFSQSTANNMMKLYEEYGAEQISIFGAVANSQTIENLPYTKALQLLAVPAEEREEFIKETNAEELSVRELKAAIDERDRAKREAEEAKEREAELKERTLAAERAAKASEEKAAEAKYLRDRVRELEKKALEAQQKAQKAADELATAISAPVIPEDKLNEISKSAEEKARAELKKSYDEKLKAAKQKAAEAEAKAKAEALKELSGELEEAKRAAEVAEGQANAAKAAEGLANERLSEMKEKLKIASPAVSEFKALYDNLQRCCADLFSRIENIALEDAEVAKKLRAAMSALGRKMIGDAENDGNT